MSKDGERQKHRLFCSASPKAEKNGEKAARFLSIAPRPLCSVSPAVCLKGLRTVPAAPSIHSAGAPGGSFHPLVGTSRLARRAESIGSLLAEAGVLLRVRDPPHTSFFQANVGVQSCRPSLPSGRKSIPKFDEPKRAPGRPFCSCAVRRMRCVYSGAIYPCNRSASAVSADAGGLRRFDSRCARQVSHHTPLGAALRERLDRGSTFGCPIASP